MDIEISQSHKQNESFTTFTLGKPVKKCIIFDTSFAEEAIPFHYEFSPLACQVFCQNKLRPIRKITFPVSRYGKYGMTFLFKNYITLERAIQVVEEYLSVPLTNEYFERIKDDVFFEDFEDYFLVNECPNRGTVLSTNNFLLDIKIPLDEPNAVYL